MSKSERSAESRKAAREKKQASEFDAARELEAAVYYLCLAIKRRDSAASYGHSTKREEATLRRLRGKMCKAYEAWRVARERSEPCQTAQDALSGAIDGSARVTVRGGEESGAEPR